MNPLCSGSQGAKSLRKVRFLLVLALSFLSAGSGFAQLIYLSDTRSVGGYADVNSEFSTAPYYTTSFTGNFSGSASPAQFANFATNWGGAANFVGGLFSTNPAGGGTDLPMTINSTVSVSQNSFLQSQELYYSSFETVSGTPGDPDQPSGYWSGAGTSSLQVSFEVLSPVSYTLRLVGTGDSAAGSDTYNLSSAAQGTLVGGSTYTMLFQQHNYGGPIYYSGVFDPGNTYTLTLTSSGNLDGAGLMADLTVPEPSMPALAGLVFLIFCFRRRGQANGHRPFHFIR